MELQAIGKGVEVELETFGLPTKILFDKQRF